MKLNKNTKIAKSDGFWNWPLPAGTTCPKAGECKGFCYAMKGNYTRFSAVKDSHRRNYNWTLGCSFVPKMIKHIQAKRKCTAVRIHDSGDFYDQTYLEDWTAIAKACPDVHFYCYTKSLHLDWDDFNTLPNTKMIQSEGGQLDSRINYGKPHARIFKDLKSLQKAGYVDCSSDDSLASINGINNIGLIEH